MQKTALRLLNSEALTFGLIIGGSICISVSVLLPELATQAVLTGLALITGASLLVVHKIRRTAIRIREVAQLQRVQHATFSTTRLSMAPAPPPHEPQSRKQPELPQEYYQTIEELQTYCHSESHRLTRAVSDSQHNVKQIAASIPSLAHPGLSALDSSVLYSRLTMTSPSTVTVAGDARSHELARWVTGASQVFTKVEFYDPNTAPLELALIQTLIVDLSDASRYKAHDFIPVGHMLPGSEVWIIGNVLEQRALFHKIQDKEPDILAVITDHQSNCFTIARKAPL
ncbi:hypothetical protein BJEO58_02869 [Brevibacterium jeotgali]|uniref:Uncharacterized protein n=1 Tax=Brevibacterium jeotgali TaxID=1262550 RepID=A0A2H1L8P3_9MICO|nr:hypothetical protein FB108_2126 [Brevibacterium jeotgali]SMY13257.1 hypothetical protein BJEO58_02869 [Brevibacterium jeotgali]